MTRNTNENGTLNPYTIRPQEILTGDCYGYKILVRVDESTWTAYKGLTDWSDEKVLAEGDAITGDMAIELFPSLQYGRTYYM